MAPLRRPHLLEIRLVWELRVESNPLCVCTVQYCITLALNLNIINCTAFFEIMKISGYQKASNLIGCIKV